MLLRRLCWQVRRMAGRAGPWLPVIISAAWDRTAWLLVLTIALVAIQAKTGAKAYSTSARVDKVVASLRNGGGSVTNTASAISGTVTGTPNVVGTVVDTSGIQGSVTGTASSGGNTGGSGSSALNGHTHGIDHVHSYGHTHNTDLDTDISNIATTVTDIWAVLRAAGIA